MFTLFQLLGTGYESTLCEIESDECISAPCQNGGVCDNLINKFECTCAGTGFDGILCENNIDECLSVPCQVRFLSNNLLIFGKKLQNGATCNDEVLGYTCTCSLGWTSTHCEESVDDCTDLSCLNNGTCIDGHNSFVDF